MTETAILLVRPPDSATGRSQVASHRILISAFPVFESRRPASRKRSKTRGFSANPRAPAACHSNERGSSELLEAEIVDNIV
jgi:hypothetical protein